jgi:hypothetical protein
MLRDIEIRDGSCMAAVVDHVIWFY